MSTYDLLGVPTQIGILLFTLALVFALIPYVGGSDFGVLKVPAFDEKKTRPFKLFGWAAPLVALSLFFPLWPKQRASTAPPGTTAPAAVKVDPTAPPAVKTDSTAPRLRIAILPYQIPDPASQSQFQEFRDALTNKIFNISQTFAARGAAFKYVDQLKVLNDGPPMASAAELNAFWNESHALQLVRGQVDTGVRPTVVHSLIFLGDLAPSPQHAGLQIDTTISPGAFSRNQDSYSLVVLYALAQDARRRRLPNDVVATFLAQAYSIGSQLDDPGGDLTPIKIAVDTMLRALETAPPTP